MSIASRWASDVARASIATVALLSTTVADADPSEPPRSDPSKLPVWFTVMPDECAPYATMPADAGDVLGWDRLLSLATCIQDASVARVETSEGVAELVAKLDDALTPSLTLNVYAIKHGPDTVKVRAAYQVGMAYVGLITRARSSLVAPRDLDADPKAATRFRELHVELERLLEPARRAAGLAFAAIDQVGSEAPEVANDPVTANMVRSARAVLRFVTEGHDERTMTARLERRDHGANGCSSASGGCAVSPRGSAWTASVSLNQM
jgi:hypothetical protein